MELIDKDAVVAEINRVLNSYDPNEITSGRYALVSLRNFLDTLEVEEVNFEEELKCYCNDYYNCDYPKQLEEESCSEAMPHIVSAAKHFYSLGLKAQKGE